MELRKNQEGKHLGCPLNHCSVSAVLWARRSAAELCVRDCLVSPWTLRFCQLCRKGADVCVCVGWGGCWERNAQCLESCEYFWCSVPPFRPAPDFVIPWKITDSCNEADLRMVSYINCKHFYLLHLSCSFPFQPSTLLFRLGEKALRSRYAVDFSQWMFLGQWRTQGTSVLMSTGVGESEGYGGIILCRMRKFIAEWYAGAKQCILYGAQERSAQDWLIKATCRSSGSSCRAQTHLSSSLATFIMDASQQRLPVQKIRDKARSLCLSQWSVRRAKL